MPMPPKTPVQINGVPMDYFDALILQVKDIYEEAELPLDFTGYEETISQFTVLEHDNFEISYELAQELLAWNDYINNLKSLTKKLLLDAETDKISEIAQASIKADSNKVANGERLANKDSNVINARKKRNSLEAFYDLLEAKSLLLNQAFYFCKSTCEWGTKLNPNIQSQYNGKQ